MENHIFFSMRILTINGYFQYSKLSVITGGYARLAILRPLGPGSVARNGDGVLQIEEFVRWLFAAFEVDS